MRLTRKFISAGLLSVAGVLLFSGNVKAAGTGWCRAVDGVQNYNYTFNYNLTNPEDNREGHVIRNAFEWGGGGTYRGTCDCTSTDGVGQTFFNFRVPSSLSFHHSDGGLNYYSISDNLAAATEIWVSGNTNRFFPTPQANVSNNWIDYSLCNGNTSNFTTGSRGRLSLYFKRSFVGQVTIPNTVVAEVYASVANNSFNNDPMARVSLQGTVTVPQSCRINDGAVIDVDFGSILSSSLATQGSGPVGYTKRVVEMAYICTNVSEGVRLSFTFNGGASPDDVNSLATDNDDVGVRIEDMSGAAITPNSGELSGTFDFDSQSGSTRFQAYPINTTGNQPAAGNFSSTATITTNME
ncbi:fimbrial protein [Serratia rubidaea]|uniref:fimbrial protein n=1 Tax=Serratia rubidaea TaxID=61652 RepID=UPI003FA35EAD